MRYINFTKIGPARLIIGLLGLVTIVTGHAGPLNPAPRSGFVTPNCGIPGDSSGATPQDTVPGELCGICGDNYALVENGTPHPFPYEYGGVSGMRGRFAQYRQNGTLSVRWIIKVIFPHFGFFECRLATNPDQELNPGQAAFDLLTILDAQTEYPEQISFTPGDTRVYVNINHQMAYWTALIINITVQIDPSVQCQNCVMQFNYRSGANFTHTKNGTAILSPWQETFRECSDIGISGVNDPVTLLQSVSTQHCLAINPAVDGGVHLVPCDATQPDQWIKRNYNNFKILDKNNPDDFDFDFFFWEANGNCLGTFNHSIVWGARAGHSYCDGSNNWDQQFKIKDNITLTFQLANRKPRICLTVGAGTEGANSVYQYGCDTTRPKSQLWKLLTYPQIPN